MKGNQAAELVALEQACAVEMGTIFGVLVTNLIMPPPEGTPADLFRVGLHTIRKARKIANEVITEEMEP